MKRASVVRRAFVDRSDDVAGGLLGHAIERREPVDAQAVKIDRRVHDACVDQLIDQLVAQPFDIHRAAAGKMQQRLLALRRAHETAGAARDRLVRQANHRRAALRATIRHDEDTGVGRSLRLDDADDLGDDVARPAHDRRCRRCARPCAGSRPRCAAWRWPPSRRRRIPASAAPPASARRCVPPAR